MKYTHSSHYKECDDVDVDLFIMYSEQYTSNTIYMCILNAKATTKCVCVNSYYNSYFQRQHKREWDFSIIISIISVC